MGYLFLASIYLVQDVWRYSTIIDLLSNFPITNKKDGYAYVDASSNVCQICINAVEKII